MHTWCVAGRNFLRCVVGRDESNLNIVVINDSGPLALPRLSCGILGVPALLLHIMLAAAFLSGAAVTQGV